MGTMKTTLLASGLAVLLALGGTHASGINGVNGGMPNRISMNVTVPKQTQGATFGEKVNAGLHAAGSVVSQGASAVIVECGETACAVAFPGGDGYRADLRAMTLAPLDTGQAAGLRNGVVTQGASLLGGAMPGGGIVSAAVSSVSALAGGGSGAAAASYAATGRVTNAPAPLSSRSDKPGVVDVLEPLGDGDYQLTLVVQKATPGLKDTLKTQVRARAPERVQIVLAFSVEAGVLKARHDVALNAIRNLR
ncbi:MAG TPA: hypothetical protein VLC71_10400 [Thermomonas sp.]|nr:hypothetical protein [Thermomonas sp.]